MKNLTYRLMKKIDRLSDKFREEKGIPQIKSISYWIHNNWLYHTISLDFYNREGECSFYDNHENEQNLNFKTRVFKKRTVIEVINELKLHYGNTYFQGSQPSPTQL